MEKETLFQVHTAFIFCHALGRSLQTLGKDELESHSIL